MASSDDGLSRIGRIASSIRHRRYLRSVYLLSNLYDGPTMIKVEGDPASKVLVISPHQDDEIIGCGGTLRRLVDQGARVKVVYLTDGGKGTEGVASEDQTRIREREAEAGLSVLGIEDKLFLRYPDQELTSSPEVVRTVGHVIKEATPDILFVPYFLDTHPDHAIASRIVGEALRTHPRDTMCYSYEVWTALAPNIIVDVTDVMDAKIQALREHASQVRNCDYPEKVRGLNAFRSMHASPGITHCEAFIRQSRKEFLRMMGLSDQS